MATQSTATSSEGKNPVTKSPRQKITEEVLPKVNPDVPLRPSSNNDPNKPADAKALNEVAAANSNHGIQRPPGTPERPSAAYWASKGITEPTVPGAVDPNSRAYAEAQRASYQKLMAQGPTAEDRLLMRGVDQNVSRGQMPVIRGPEPAVPTGTTGTVGRTSASSNLTFGDFSAKMKNDLPPEQYKLFQSLSPAVQTNLYNRFKAQQIRQMGTTGTTGTTGTVGALPAGGSPIPTAETAPLGRDEKMLKVLRDSTADPQARAQAKAYLTVKTMYAQKGKYANEIKALERGARAYRKQLDNMFKNTLNRRDPRYQQQYDHLRLLRKNDPQAKLIMYTELLKRPEFASLRFK